MPSYMERLFAYQLSIYRVMNDLLRRTKKRGKQNPDFRALARKFETETADALIAMHDMPGREAQLHRWVQGWMEELSGLGLPIPTAVLEFNRELSGIAGDAKTDIDDEKRALFYQCLADDPACSNNSIANRISGRVGPITPPTVKAWRSEPYIEGFLDTVERRRFLGIKPVNPLSVDDSERRVQARIELETFEKKFSTFEDRALATIELGEIRRRRGISPEPVQVSRSRGLPIVHNTAGGERRTPLGRAKRRGPGSDR